MPPRNPALNTAERATPKQRIVRYVVEIRSIAGVSHFLTTADWTDNERDVAMAGILRLLGYRPAKSRQKATRSSER